MSGQVVAWKNAIAGLVNELPALRYSSAEGSEQMRSEVALWERALDRCEKVLTAMARLNIDERLARVSEEQGARSKEGSLSSRSWPRSPTSA
jgi:hypothetical protein